MDADAPPWRYLVYRSFSSTSSAEFSYQCHLTFNLFLPTPLYDCLPVEAGKNVTDFGAALTEAVVTNNTLELADGTFFVGEAKLGSKLFIRPCYKELSELVLDGASCGTFSDIVVTGTPRIGKSMFGFYLLYLLRCRGKNVVFEVKGDWYRFSDAGVGK